MRRFVLEIGLTIAALGLLGQNRAFGTGCGAAAAESGCNSQPGCTAMKTCQEVVYEYKEMTAYKVVYEDVETPVTVPAVEYVPAPRVVCVPDTVLVPPTPGACPPAACPPANACGPCAAQNLVPMNICRKVEMEGFRPVETQKPAVCKRVVARQVPYQVTICIPHIVTRQVPVCCPAPCCTCAAPAAAPKAPCEPSCGK